MIVMDSKCVVLIGCERLCPSQTPDDDDDSYFYHAFAIDSDTSSIAVEVSYPYVFWLSYCSSILLV